MQVAVGEGFLFYSSYLAEKLEVAVGKKTYFKNYLNDFRTNFILLKDYNPAIATYLDASTLILQ